MADAATATAPATGGQGGTQTGTPASGQGAGTQSTTTTATTTTAANTNFYDSFQDAGLKEWAGKKGWTNIESLAKSAHSLEQMIGAPADEVIRLPKNADPTAVRGILSRLGMPDTADKYEIAPPPEGTAANENVTAWTRETFHKLGLTATQAKELSAAYSKFSADMAAQAAKDYSLGVDADDKALRNEWRAGYDTQMAKGQNAARALFGEHPEAIDAIETAIGYGATMRLFAQLGAKLGESGFVQGDGSTRNFGSTMTPAEAKAEWAKVSTDAGFAAALMNRQHPGHKAAMEKKSALIALGAAD